MASNLCEFECTGWPHGNVKKTVELLSCLPGSSASVESVFLINCIWSEEMSRFQVDKLQAILAVKKNRLVM
jgi:hypothetical protein